MHPYRTHTCGELRPAHVGQTVRISGWVHSVRDHGGIVFIDLRDHYGITQVVVQPDSSFGETCRHAHSETVLCFTGPVVLRDPSTVNDKLPTGDVEVRPATVEVLGEAEILPFQIADDQPCAEHIRLKYRFLDLRRDKLHRNIMLRSEVIALARQLMIEQGFREFQTPILTSSSPEGARDFLVPSRLHPGQFYALPQAPQQFKQLLMVAGFDRYFQIAPCFRDEDSRADRSPGEFYQLDLEMSFVEQEDIFRVVERVMGGIFGKFAGSAAVDATPFVRIPYRQSMLEFGCDKPDLRNPLRVIDVTEVFRETEFKAFTGVVQRGGVVRAIAVKGIANQPRKFFDDMIEFAQGAGAKGLGYIGWVEGKPRSPIAKFLGEDHLASLQSLGNAGEGDVMFFLADAADKVPKLGAAILAELAVRLDLLEKNAFRFCWIVDYPMYERHEETHAIEFSHNPFSMPQGGLEALLTKDPLDILAYQYDLVCNGIELSSGAIRNHRPDIMYKAFEIGGYPQSEVDRRFGGMINAFKLGAPPHGGIAPGIDRIVMLLANEKNIREVIAFPLNQQAQDLMMNAPSEVDEKQLRELHIRIRTREKQ